MKKTLLLMVIAVMTASAALAQRTISGKVIEKETNEAVIQATVALLKSDSTLVGNAVTNMNGQFQTTAPQDGNYILRITYVGFKTYTRHQSRFEDAEERRGGEEHCQGDHQRRHPNL